MRGGNMGNIEESMGLRPAGHDGSHCPRAGWGLVVSSRLARMVGRRQRTAMAVFVCATRQSVQRGTQMHKFQ